VGGERKTRIKEKKGQIPQTLGIEGAALETKGQTGFKKKELLKERVEKDMQRSVTRGNHLKSVKNKDIPSKKRSG